MPKENIHLVHSPQTLHQCYDGILSMVACIYQSLLNTADKRIKINGVNKTFTTNR